MTDRIEVLDKGYVELQDFMGSDTDIVNAARVSVLGESKGDVKDKKLLAYLWNHQHTSPFEQCEFKFRVHAPLFVARQWMRHRTWNYNETSRRYTSKDIEFYFPEMWRLQGTSNKQSSDGVLSEMSNVWFTSKLIALVDSALELYNELIEANVSREMARIVLPVNLYTTFIAKVDALNLIKFIRLRTHAGAQHEIQVYAEALDEFLRLKLPWTHEVINR